MKKTRSAELFSRREVDGLCPDIAQGRICSPAEACENRSVESPLMDHRRRLPQEVSLRHFRNSHTRTSSPSPDVSGYCYHHQPSSHESTTPISGVVVNQSLLPPILDIVFKMLSIAPETQDSLTELLSAVLKPERPIRIAKILNPIFA